MTAGEHEPALSPVLELVHPQLALDTLARGAHLEIGWCGRWDHDAGRLASVRWCCTGSRDLIRLGARDLEDGEDVLLHRHPSRGWLTPSPQDIETAHSLAPLGLGCVIISHDCREAVVIREPRRPKAPAWRKFARLRLGRWQCWLAVERSNP